MYITLLFLYSLPFIVAVSGGSDYFDVLLIKGNVNNSPLHGGLAEVSVYTGNNSELSNVSGAKHFHNSSYLLTGFFYGFMCFAIVCSYVFYRVLDKRKILANTVLLLAITLCIGWWDGSQLIFSKFPELQYTEALAYLYPVKTMAGLKLATVLGTASLLFILAQKITSQLNENRVHNIMITDVVNETAKLSFFTAPAVNNVDYSQVKLLYALTDSEVKVLKCITEGLNNTQISKELFISVNTVKYHVRNIYEKLDINSKSQAVSKILGPAA